MGFSGTALFVDRNTDSAADCEALCASTSGCNYWWHISNRCNMYETVTGLTVCAGGCTAGPVDCKLERGGMMVTLLLRKCSRETKMSLQCAQILGFFQDHIFFDIFSYLEHSSNCLRSFLWFFETRHKVGSFGVCVICRSTCSTMKYLLL